MTDADPERRADPVTDVDLVLDVRGRHCPLPVIELARHLADVDVGGVVVVLSDDPAARLDIPEWCRMRDQHYLGAEAWPAPNATGTDTGGRAGIEAGTQAGAAKEPITAYHVRRAG